MKTIGVFQLAQMKFDCFEFEGPWAASFGRPEKNFSAIIHGPSGNGKTDFCVKFAKYLSRFTKVLYLSHEEGISSTIQEAFNRNNMIEVSGKVVLAEKGSVDELIEYLKKRNSPGAVIIDSLDYMRLTTEQYKRIRAEFPKKAIIIVAWSKGDLPKSQSGKDIEYMCDIKIRVKAYLAHPRCRYGGNDPYVIWKEKAQKMNPPGLFDATIEEREEMLEQSAISMPDDPEESTEPIFDTAGVNVIGDAIIEG